MLLSILKYDRDALVASGLCGDFAPFLKLCAPWLVHQVLDLVTLVLVIAKRSKS